MSVTSGFFNAVNSDRLYDANQLCEIVDGIVANGVFQNIGSCFAVTPVDGMDISVGVGRAWFDKKWIYNDSVLRLEIGTPAILDRYDAVVIDVDKTEAVRACTIKVVEGSPSSSPVYPELANETGHKQYPIAYILVRSGVSAISSTDITNMVGTEACPYVPTVTQTATEGADGLMSAADKKKLDELLYSDPGGEQNRWRKLTINNKLCMWIQVRSNQESFTGSGNTYTGPNHRAIKPTDCSSILYANATMTAGSPNFITTTMAYDTSNDDILFRGVTTSALTNTNVRLYVVIFGLTA